MDKKALSERDICTKFIAPAIESAGWDMMDQVREEVSFTAGPILVRGNMAVRDKKKIKRADYILYYKPNRPIPYPFIPPAPMILYCLRTNQPKLMAPSAVEMVRI